MAAIDANRGVPAGPTTTPLYEQAKQIRHRAVASDLRKGVILLAVGLGLSFYSMISDGDPTAIGLVCLFLGVGYLRAVVLQSPKQAPGASPPPPGGA